MMPATCSSVSLNRFVPGNFIISCVVQRLLQSQSSSFLDIQWMSMILCSFCETNIWVTNLSLPPFHARMPPMCSSAAKTGSCVCNFSIEVVQILLQSSFCAFCDIQWMFAMSILFGFLFWCLNLDRLLIIASFVKKVNGSSRYYYSCQGYRFCIPMIISLVFACLIFWTL